ncbi:oligosaccharide repeat unit polymerase [Enterobacter kobei]|uniref:oligosaccharide repeat unit polymerase n=1 Tax=Enterobacter kobei TaxID=208224 RepID=UPI0032AEB223
MRSGRKKMILGCRPGDVMIYAVIFALATLAALELFLSGRKISPSLVMLSIWTVSLAACSFYEDDVSVISGETLLWISIGNICFFFGGIIGRIIFNRGARDYNLTPVSLFFLAPVYALTCFLMYQMYLSGSQEASNWYVGIRTIINYGDPNIFFKIFGYMYFILYPCLYVAAASYYKNPSKSGAKAFWSLLFFCVVYAAFSTAKIKILLIIIPVFFIRTYFRPSSTKLIALLGMIVLGAMYLSLFLLNKISGDGNFTDLLLTNIGNYTFSNIFSFDSLNFTPIGMGECNDASGCQLLPFYEGGDFRTNVYTIMYWFIDYGLAAFSLFCLLIGVIHNGAHSVARISKNIVFVICSSVLYFPLIFQIMDDQYTSSKYLLWLYAFTLIIVYSKRTRLFVRTAP